MASVTSLDSPQAGELSGSDREIRPVGAFTLVLHGASGDLARRKIIPALARLAHSGYFPVGSRVVLSQRGAPEPAEALAQVESFLLEAGDQGSTEFLPSLKPFLRTLSLSLGGDAPAVAQQKLALQAALAGGPEPVVHYASLPASRFVDLLALIDPVRDPARMRLVLEKPLGRSGEESKQIEEAVAAKLDESQVYRIDHYLGKQAVQNLLALRLGNRIFEPLLTREHVAHVQITVAEDLGVEGRAAFYEQTGALRDMVQSHLLQLLATVAMEPPASLNPDALRDEKLKVLRALKVPTLSANELVVGQYMGGSAGVAYSQEAGVAKHSRTETFVAFQTEVQTWRWAGVPFLLRTGKRMPARRAEILIQFRDVPRQLFTPVGGQWAGNRLVIQLQPDDRLELHLLAKSPGERERLRPVVLDLDFFTEWRVPVRDAYERLIADVLRGRLNLFLRRDEVQAQWAFVDAIHADLHAQQGRPLAYPAGSYGPSAATTLALRAGATWAEDSRIDGA
jgi:glucose-6-phosphate 1-dehydrogenase